jgi:diguanylate cyclase (GGDEF)-like protein/PAS domain S-box-containing protein
MGLPRTLGRQVRRHWLAYLLRMLALTLLVLLAAYTQFTRVLDLSTHDLHAGMFVIPGLVGLLFGFLLTSVELAWRQRVEQARALDAGERRLRVEVARREAFAAREERLNFALEGANDGLWDWDVRSGEAYSSPRWEALLGLEAGTLAPKVNAWSARVHAQDAPGLKARIDAALRGESEQFNCEFRIRHADGHWVWVLGRGKVVERGSRGEALRMVGTMTDVSERKRVELAVAALLTDTAGLTGQAFFDRLLRAVGEAFEVPCAFMVRIDEARDEVRLMATWGSGPPPASRLGPLTKAVLLGGLRVWRRAANRELRDDPLLGCCTAEAVVAAPIEDGAGRRVGLVAVVDQQALSASRVEAARSVLPLFAARVGAELERLRVEAALMDEKERAQITLHSIADAVIATDAEGRVEYMNAAAERITGWSAQEAAGASLEVVCPEAGDAQPGHPASSGSSLVSQGTRLRTRRGHELSVERTAAPIFNRSGVRTGTVTVFRDVTDSLEMAAKVTWQASHDALTGLVNRKEFERRLEGLIESSLRDEQQHVLLYLDLDQFKVVNDTSGHTAGDELLRQLAQRLQRRVRQSDTLARLGGDEFGVLLPQCDVAAGQRIAEKLIESVRDHRFAWRDTVFDVGASVGLVQISGLTADSTTVLSAADMACYAAKERGRNRIHVYQADDEVTGRRQVEMQWATQIRQALEMRAFALHAQEICALRPARRRHFEILLRMLGTDGALIMPGSFIPAAERYQLMPELDRHVVQSVFALVGREPCLRDIQLAINLSGRSLGDEGLLDFILERADAHAIDPGRICFEITETSAISNLSAAAVFMQGLRERGFLFALDDFGSGVSSFGYLKELSVDYLKIDGGFVKDLARDPIDAAMVQAIHEIGHTIGIETIAEYVEDEVILRKLREIGVDHGQGYHLHRPEPIEALIARLRAGA